MRTLRMLAVLGWGIVALNAAAAAQAQIPWITDWRQARDLAQQQRRLVLLHFWSESCEPCARLEHQVFNRPEVARAISTGYIPVKVNVEQEPQLTSHYQVSSWPTDVIVDPKGRVIRSQGSPQDPNQYIALLDQVKAYYNTTLATAPNLPASLGGSPGTLADQGPQLSLSGQPSPPKTNPQDSVFFQANQSPSRYAPSHGSADPFSGNPAQTAPVGQPYANPHLGPPQSPPTPAEGELARANLVENPHLNARSPAMPVPAPHAAGEFDGSAAYANPAAQPTQQAVMPGPASYQPGGTTHTPPQQASPSAPPQSAQPAQTVQHLSPNTQVPAAPQAPLALDGYCPIALVEQNTWSKGDSRWGVEHRGRLYLFTTYVNQQRFRANPDLYSPVLSGYDPVVYFDQGQLVEGKREHGLYYGDQYFLFADEMSLERFHNAPQRYVAQAQAAMQR